MVPGEARVSEVARRSLCHLVPALPGKVSVKFSDEGDKAVEDLGAPSERHHVLQLLGQTPMENPQEQSLFLPGLHCQHPELNGVFSHRARSMLNGQKSVGGVGHIVRVVEHCLEFACPSHQKRVR